MDKRNSFFSGIVQFLRAAPKMTDESYEILRDQHRRLRVAAQALVDEAHAVGTPERPLVGLEPYLLRNLRRELTHEPQASGFFTMSVS